ncbi:MAG: ABC transporter permease [Anaerolineae bacterium]
MASPSTLREHPAVRKGSLRLASLAVAALLWEVFGRTQSSLLFPSLTETVRALADLVQDPVLWQSLWLSNQALLIGYLAAVITGVPLGLLLGRSRLAEHLADPYINIVLVTPIAAMIPVLLMALGLGLTARAVVVFSFAQVVITVNTRAGMRHVSKGLVAMARTYGANEAQLWRKVLLPGALPGVLTGLRLGLARALAGMVAVELLFVAVGVGRMVLRFQGDFEAAYVYGVVASVLIEALILLKALQLLSRRLTRWLPEVVVE